MTSLTGKNSIAGQWSAQGDETFTSVDPRTKQPGDVQFHNATKAEIDHAVNEAAAAFQETRHYPASKLADFLDTAAEEIEKLREELVETADYETGLGSPRLPGELTRTTSQLKAFASLLREGSYVDAIIDTAMPDRQPAPRPDLRRMLIPIGPVAVFSASNFPFAFATAGGDTASAFAAGCPVIVKGHPGHPATTELFTVALNNAVKACDFPAGFFSMVQGNGVEVGQNLVQHPLLEAVGFTGSLRGGRALYDSAAQRPRPIPVYAEMGSVNPFVIMPGAIEARGDSLVDTLVGSATLGAGQFCTNPGLVLILESDATQDFIQRYTAAMQAKQPEVMLNASIESGLARAVEQTVGAGGVDLLTGGEVVDGGGFCYAHTVMQTNSTTFRSNPKLHEEHFGPVTLFITCPTLDDLRLTLNTLEGQLTGTIQAEADEVEAARPVAEALRERVGRLIWNGVPTGVEVVYSQQHGGPYPATTAPGTTSVGMTAIKRFMRPLAYQSIPSPLLPDALKDENPLGILRIVNNEYTREPIQS
ncbi:MAG: aldehyde dehydrogenase (NADP(+)) [Anaerolineaceae bacterium]|nr:aldehyde dehydrogenase (NADP(+)) [Anaerolineaceae bacterium]